MLKYPASIHPEEVGFWVEFPDLPGCVTQGDTIEELIYMAEDALSLYLGVLYDDERKIPEPSNLSGDNIIYINVAPEVAIPILLRRLRKEKNLSMEDVAQLMHVSYQAYQKLENVAKFNATVKTLQKVARALGKKFVATIE